MSTCEEKLETLKIRIDELAIDNDKLVQIICKLEVDIEVLLMDIRENVITED
jgi:hypothetical protein